MKLRLHRHSLRKSSGFTLLEVMVALTITGLALGSLFGIVAGSKQLAWRSEKILLEATEVRKLINFSQLDDTHGQLNLEFENDALLLTEGELFEVPDRKTQSSLHTLRQYEVLDETNQLILTGSYWLELDLPE